LGTDSEVEASVVEYLRRHPYAADSLDGVVQWWLPRQRYETARERIGVTLEQMVAGGQLERRALPDGTAIYSLRREEGERCSAPGPL
jgi:hypothetical protein